MLAVDVLPLASAPRSCVVVTALCAIAFAGPAAAVANGDPLVPVATHTVFGAAVGVGNTLMEHDGQTNFALRAGGSEALIPLSRMAPDATVVRAFLFWAGTFTLGNEIPLDRDVDLTLPSGAFFNDLGVDTLTPGEPASALSQCVRRNHNVNGQIQPMFVCRREVTFLLQQLGAGGAVGVYGVDDVDLKAGDCVNEPGLCQAAFGGWGLVVLWESPTEPVRRDLVLYDGFFALDEQGTSGGGGGFSSGIGPAFQLDGFTIGPTADGELTFMGFEGDAQLGVPPQNLAGNPARCNDGQCADFMQVRTNGNATFTRLSDATNRPGNLWNGSNNLGGGQHPGLDIDTFDIGPSGLNILRSGDTRLFVQPGSGDGVADDGSGGSGELILLGFTLLSAETFSPRFLNTGTEKVVLEPVAGAGETLNYILRVENDGSAPATNTVLRDQLPAGVTYVAASTTNTCGVASADIGGTSPLLVAGGLSVGTLSVGERCEVRFRGTIDADVTDGTVLDNFFTITADGVPATLVGPASTVVEAAELGRPTKTVAVLGGSEPSPGATLVYTVRIPNTGARTAPSVALLDVIPAQLEALQVLSTPPGSTNASSVATGTVDIRNITIAAGSTAEVVFSARIRAGTATGTPVSNQGSVDQPSLAAPLATDDPSTASSPDPTTVIVSAGLALTGSSKTVTDVDGATDGGRVEPGDVLEFRVRVQKSGPTPTIVSLADELPANVTSCSIVSSPPGGFSACSAGGVNGTGRVDGATAFGAAPAGGSLTADFVFRVTVAAGAPDGFVLVNTARLTPQSDPVFAVDVSSPPVSVFARPVFTTSTKTALDVNGGDPRPNDLVRYTISARNDGTVPAQNVVVTDAVPAGLVSVVALDGGVLSAGTLTWTLAAPLAVGASVDLRFEARIAPGTVDGTVIANAATVSASPPAASFTTPPAVLTVRSSPALVVTKAVADTGTAPFRPGDTVRYTVVVRNDGDGAATSVVVRDPLDVSFETVVSTGGGRAEGGDLVFDSATTPALASLAPGAPVTLVFDVQLDGILANGTVVANQARTTATQVPTPVLSDDPATAPPDATTFVVTSQAVLAIDKTFSDDNFGALLPADLVTYTLAVRNTGDAPATLVSVSDALDARLAFVSSSDGGSVAGADAGGFGGTVSFPTFTQLPGPARALRFTVRVRAPLANGTAIDNQASGASPVAASAVSDDPTTVALNDPTRIVVVSRPVLDATTKIVTDLDAATDGGAFEPGDRVRYDIVVRNTGSEDALTVVVTDVVPAALGAVVVGQGGAFAPGGGGGGGGTATWTLGTVAVGASVALTVEATLARPLADLVVVANQAVVSNTGFAPTNSDDPTTVAVGDPTRFTVTSKPRLSIDKTVVDDNGGSVEPGDTLTYTLHVESTGGRDANDVTLADVVDARLVGVTALDGGVAVGGAAGPGQGALPTNVTWTFASIAVDASVDVRFRATVALPLPNGTVIDNQARASLAEPGVPGAPFPSDDPATAAPLDPTRVQVVSAADLAATTLESVDPTTGLVLTTARPGANVRYAIEVRNRGNAAGDAVVVTLPLPAEAAFVDAVGGTFTGGTVVFTAAGVPALANVAPGAVVPLAVHVRLLSPLDDGTLVSAQARLAATGVVTPFPSDDPSTAAAGDPTVFEIESAPVLTAFDKVLADENGAPVEPGDVVAFTLTAQNDGDAIARNVTYVDTLPAALGVEDAGGAAVAGQTLTFTIASIAPGERVARTLRARVGAGTANGTVVSNQAFVDAANDAAAAQPSDDPTTGAADDPTSFIVVTVPRVRVTKDVEPRIAAPGDVLRYTIVVTSVGSAPTGPASLVDVVSPALTDVTPGPGAVFNAPSGELRANIPPLAAPAVPGGSGETVTLTYTARVGDDVVNGTSIPNQARVGPLAGGGPGVFAEVLSDDPDTAPLADPTIVLVDSLPVVALTKTAVDVNGAPLAPGDVVRWDLAIANTGNGAARDVRITDAIDARLEIVSVSDGGARAGNVVVWDGTTTPALAVVARGEALTVSVTTRVLPTVGDGARIENQAQLGSPDVAGAVLSDDPATLKPGDATAVVVSAPVVALEKRFVDLDKGADGGAVEPGDLVEYQITARNDGSVAATGVEVTDVVPGVLVDVEVLDGGVDDGGLLRWTIPALAPGEAVVVRLRARVDPLAGGGTLIVNAAEATANEAGVAVRSDDPDTATPNDDTVRVVAGEELFTGTVELFDGRPAEEGGGLPLAEGAFVNAGDRVRARVTFTNEGTQTARNIAVRVPFEVLRFAVDETTEGGVVETSGPQGRAVRWDASQTPALVQVDPGETVVVELEGAIASPIPNGVEIAVAAFVTSLATTVPVELGPATVRVRSRADLSATTKEVVDDDGGLVEPGDVLSYRITVLNDGGTLARNVRVLDAIPGGTVYVAGTTRARGAPVSDVEGEGGGVVAPSLAGIALGDVDAGRSAVVELKVRVSPQAPRGLRIDNQGVLRADGLADAVSDNPATPLITGDATPVVVGGGASLIAQKVALTQPATLGEPLRFAIHVENVGTEPALDVVIEDPLPLATVYVQGSLAIDGVAATDAVDRDDGEVDGGGIGGGGLTVRARRDVLEAGEGFTFTFAVRPTSGTAVSNQGTVTSQDGGVVLTDGDTALPGAQATVVPLRGARGLVLERDTVALLDDDGGALEAGDRVTVRARVKNLSLEDVRVGALVVQASAQLAIEEASVDPRFTLDAATRAVSLRAGVELVVEANGAFDVVFQAIVAEDANVGDVVRAVGQATAVSLPGAGGPGAEELSVDVDLGAGELTVGLLPGTGAIEGTLFLDAGEHDGVFDPTRAEGEGDEGRDQRARGITVLAFWRDDTEPVQTAITDESGKYRLLPIPAGRYRLELRSPGGAFFGDVSEAVLASGEVRERDVALETTGAVYVTGAGGDGDRGATANGTAARGARVFLMVDDGDRVPENDAAVDPNVLGDSQQGQSVSAQGLYRFDAPPGRYRIHVETPDALLAFPSAAAPVVVDPEGHPFGPLAGPDAITSDGDVVDAPLPLSGQPARYFLRLEVTNGGPRVQHNFIPVDRLKSQVLVTKTATRKRASIGDLVGYTVRIENRALAGVGADEGGVEIVDALPFGMKLVDGSYRLDRIERDARGEERRAREDVRDVGGRVRRFGPFPLLPRTSYELRYNVVVTPGASFGVHENRAALRMAAGQIALSDDAIAAVQIVPDGTFDLGTIRAKVWCDDDGDGWHDLGEHGLPGARLYVDTGQWADSDVEGKAHFSAIPAGMHVVKLDERTLPPGTTLTGTAGTPGALGAGALGAGGTRRTFYMSAGTPAQVSFGARCALASAGKPELVVNEAAYKPQEKAKRKVKLEGSASPPKLVVTVDGAAPRELLLPRADLGLGAESAEPTFAGAPGPNLPTNGGSVAGRMVFVPRYDGPAPATWRIVLEGPLFPRSLDSPGASGTSSASGASATGGHAIVDADPASRGGPVWMMSGSGTPPARVLFDGRDPKTGSPVLLEGNLYRATLTVGLDGGDTASSAARMFGVAAGAIGASASGQGSEVDETGGALFTRAGKPTPRLSSFLADAARAHKMSGGKGRVTVVVHTDPGPGALTTITAQRAAFAKKVLASFGVPAELIDVKGAGDAEPTVPNMRKRDRAKNRRVEIVVEKTEQRLPALVAPWTMPPSVVVNGAVVGEGAAFTSDLELVDGETLAVHMSTATGATVKLADALRAEAPAAPSAPVDVSWRPAERTLVVGAGMPVDTSLLETRVAGARVDGDAIVFATQTPPLDIAEWTLRVMGEGTDGAGRTRRELTGEGPVPAEVRWDGVDVDGKRALSGETLFARLIVKTGGGDVGISPDLVVRLAGAAPAGAPAAKARPKLALVALPESEPIEGTQTLADPTDASGKLKPAAVAELARIARGARGADVKIEVHTDDKGARLERRARTQRAADAMKDALVKNGVPVERVTALGMGSDAPVAPNLNTKARKRNRRADITVTPSIAAPLDGATSAAAPAAAPAIAPAVAPEAPVMGAPPSSLVVLDAPLGHAPRAMRANGAALDEKEGALTGKAPAMKSGEVVLDLRDTTGARASLHVRPAGGDVVMGQPTADVMDAYAAATGPAPNATAPLGVDAGPDALVAAGGSGIEDASADAGPAHPTWWPAEGTVKAAVLDVELPADTGALKSERLLVRGKTSPTNKLRIGSGTVREDVRVDPLTGAFVHVAKLPEGDSELVVEVTDDKGNVGRVRRDIGVDTTGWFALALADTAFGGAGADLAERTPYTSLTLGDTFLYGRGAAFVKGKWRGATMFQDYDLTLHVDTRRWQDDVFAPELIDPERFFPVYGDSSVENTDAMRSGFPLYLDLRADSSSVLVGNVRTEMAGADLFRYQRARSGAQLVFDRGWTSTNGKSAFDVAARPAMGEVKAAPSPEGDPWRTRVTGFVAGGGGQRHARAELLGTGSSVYFLRHERVVEGSERVALLVRDGVTGAEIARKSLVRDVDYNVRYLEGRVMMKEPVGAFSDVAGAGALTNQNLGQVASGNRVFVEVEYEHQDDDPFMGIGAGAHARQTLAGHAEVGGGYVYEAREGGDVGYQLGGGHIRLYADEGTWIQAELLGSQSVDAGNFVSFDGGLTYSSLGQSLDQKDTRIGPRNFSAERAGAAFKLDGQVLFGDVLLGRARDAGQAHAYVQQLQPGFFAGASIVEQGQTKWGLDTAWQIVDDGKLKLRYDGVISEIPEIPNVTEFRTLHREIATLRYEHRVVAPVVLAAEYGYGYTADSGSFGADPGGNAGARDFHTNVVGAGVEWQVIEALSLALKQEAMLSGDPNQLRDWNDHLITHLALKYALNDTVSLLGGVSARWSGENQAHAGVSLGVNETSRVYVTERVGLLPAPVTGTMGFRATTIVGGETELAPGSKAYAEYQLDGGLSGEQSRGVVGTKTLWKLPWGFALQFGYERILLLGGAVPTTPNGNVPPAAFTDGTFYAAPGANGGGSYLGGEGSRDALSAGVEYKSGETVVASQRFELRYDNQTESRGGHDRLWLLSGSAGAVKLSPELSLLARYNVALAQDLALAAREAYFEEGAFGVAYRPVTHDWVSVLAKISRRVDVRPLSLELGSSDDYVAHAMSIEPIVELPWRVQIVEKLALKHASQKLDDTPEAHALTGLWINRLNLHALGLIRSLGVDPILPGEIDLGVEYRMMAGFTYAAVEHGPLVEVQVAPIEYFRLGVGYNWTRFSDDELDSGNIDRSGFFVRAVGTF